MRISTDENPILSDPAIVGVETGYLSGVDPHPAKTKHSTVLQTCDDLILYLPRSSALGLRSNVRASDVMAAAAFSTPRKADCASRLIVAPLS